MFFAKKCPICGMKLTENAYETQGKKFCSKGCAEQYFSQKHEEEHEHEHGRHGCC